MQFHQTSLLIIFLSISLIGLAQGSQDSIILLNGKVFRGDIQNVENGNLIYETLDKKGNSTIEEISTYRIFSYHKDGSETILYRQDEFNGDYLTIPETRFATLGSYDARQTLKPRFVFWSSLLIGVTASLYDTFYTQKSLDLFISQGLDPDLKEVGFFGSSPSIFPITIPIVLSIGWGLPSFRIKEHQLLQKNLYGNEMYYRGFNRIARQKRIFAALKGSFIGIASGMICYSILKIN